MIVVFYMVSLSFSSISHFTRSFSSNHQMTDTLCLCRPSGKTHIPLHGCFSYWFHLLVRPPRETLSFGCIPRPFTRPQMRTWHHTIKSEKWHCTIIDPLAQECHHRRRRSQGLRTPGTGQTALEIDQSSQSETGLQWRERDVLTPLNTSRKVTS